MQDGRISPAPSDRGGRKDGDLPPEQRIRVAVRIRPYKANADQGESRQCLTVQDQSISFDDGRKKFSFNYDHVFENSTQDKVYDAIGDQMLRDAFDGYNSTIFAYGQTGSGKTYSMVGDPKNPAQYGLLPRLCNKLFEMSQELGSQNDELTVKVKISYVEVYNEQVRDLLELVSKRPPSSRNLPELTTLKLRENKKAHAFEIEGLKLHTVTNYQKVQQFLDFGGQFRVKAETGMNEESSRSHAIFCFYIYQNWEKPGREHRDMESKITVVDLAGSERQNKTGAGGNKEMQMQGININQSLLTLGQCLEKCAESTSPDKVHLPVRNSQLTKILMDIFGGNCRTCMFATVSSSLANASETLSTLRYAWDSKKIKHKAKQNTRAKAIEMNELKAQVRQLGQTILVEITKNEALVAQMNQEMRQADMEIEARDKEIEEMKKAIKELKGELKAVKRQTKGSATPGAGAADADASPTAADNSPLPRSNVPTVDTQTQTEHSALEVESGPFGTLTDPNARNKLPVIVCQDEEENVIEREMNIRDLKRLLGDALSPRRPEMPPSKPQAPKPVATVTEMRTFKGHTAAVYACAFSPDGKKMVSASRDRTLKIWSVATGHELHTLKGHTGIVLCCAYSSDGIHVASASDDKSMKIWDAEAGKKVISLKGHNDKVYSCCFSPSGVEAASACSDHTIKVWNIDSGKKLITLRGHEKAVFGVAFSNDGKKLVSASDDQTLRLWDWMTGAETNCFKGHTGTVWSCQFSPNDDKILSTSMDNTLKLWEVETGVASLTFDGHKQPVHHAKFANDGRHIISASRDKTLKVWDTATGKEIWTLKGHENYVYRCDVYKTLILSCSADTTIKAWNLKLLS